MIRLKSVNPGLIFATACLLAACSGDTGKTQFVGYIEADWHYVAAPQSGWLLETGAAEGDIVEADTVLFRLDSNRQQARLEEATARAEQAAALAKDITVGARPAEISALQAQLTQAQARLDQTAQERDRVLPLVAKKIESQARGDLAQAEYTVAQAAVAAAREAINIAQLAGRKDARDAALAGAQSSAAMQRAVAVELTEREVSARVAGSVQRVFYSKGEFVTAGSPVMALLPVDELTVRFFVPQSVLPDIHLGQQLSVSADGLSQPISASVSFIANRAEFTPPVIYSAASRDKLVFRVEATLQTGSSLPAGLPVDVSL